ncbi:MAG: Calx-beta domain-containing protein [Isosphaeraceae bacterium]|nr:Calx-beta domain-containing protein [Isosphaeraceae bacterium]
MLGRETKKPNRRRLAPGVDRLEPRALLAAGVSFAGASVQAVAAEAGKIEITLVASDSGAPTTEPVTVEVSTKPVDAVSGVDYTELRETVAFAAGETSKTIALALPTTAPERGSKTVEVALSPSPANPAGASQFFVIQHGPDRTPPRVVGSKALIKRGRLAALSLTFSESLRPETANDASNYEVFNPSYIVWSAKRRGKAPSTNLPIASARYDDASRTVTLVPATRAKKMPVYLVNDPGSASVIRALASRDLAALTRLVPRISRLADLAGNPVHSPTIADDASSINAALNVEVSTGGKAGRA